MSPRTQVLPIPQAVFQADLWLPYMDGPNGADFFAADIATRGYRPRDPTIRPDVANLQAFNDIGTGGRSRINYASNRRSVRMQANPPGGDPIAQAWKFGWYSPALNDSGDFATGFVADAWSRVAIFDWWWRFQNGTSSYPTPGGSGFFWLGAHLGSGLDYRHFPAGGGPNRALFGFEFLDDGGGNQTVGWATYAPGSGNRQTSALPSSFSNPATWHSARVTVVSATAARQAYLTAEIDGEILANRVEFDSVDLFRPTDNFGSAFTLFPAVGLEANSDQWIQFRGRARFGTTTADGVPV